MATITSKELWEEVETNQQWLDSLPEQGADELQTEAAEGIAEALATLHVLARQDW